MSKRIATSLDDRKSKKPRRPTTAAASKDEKDIDLHRFFKSIQTPLLPDLANLTSEYLDPCDYLDNTYNYCFKRQSAARPKFRDISVPDDFDVKQCCRSKCNELLDLILRPPTQFYVDGDTGNNFTLKDPTIVKITYFEDKPDAQGKYDHYSFLNYDIPTKTFSDKTKDDRKIIWSDLETTCQYLNLWNLHAVVIEYKDVFPFMTFDDKHVVDRQYKLKWLMRSWGYNTVIFLDNF